MIDTTNRSEAAETMDDFSMEGEILKDALDKIAGINQLLGGNNITLNGLKQLINKHKIEREISILDVGCGNGDMLRFLADYANRNHLNFKLTGIDANAFTIGYARKLSADYANISYRCADIFEELKQDQAYDVILCTLTLHHFKNAELLQLMAVFKTKANMGIVVNDLHRSAAAYYLFSAICFVFRLNKMSRDDGLTSILRGFKKGELLSYSKQLNLKNYTLRWCWAFRYQWVIATI
ncbi:methyltransferase domain-containing protein [Pedobacter africanus]|uniref:Methyltransferase domain-containing protein n=1 Tax=Pedobacter africanus TaxID=151894 RepID=A0A1W2D8S7_9SPHI|nr:methyltransferase domain-containing protein [Pedobacter africanus]SMC93920.1 Methyltransferase domain-containing protein [Pedobacter africanus]